MNPADQIRHIIEQAMPAEMYRKSGAVMLSGTDTLRPGIAYIMGLNPGGDPAARGHQRSILESVHERSDYSCYTNECWQPRCPGPDGACEHFKDGKPKPEFLVKHQRNAIAIADALGIGIARIFSANAVFARSTSKATLREQTGYSLDQWWSACWPVHQHFLAIVRPRMVITLGYGETSSAFGLIRNKAGCPQFRRIGDENRRGGWAFDASLEVTDGYLETTVVGVPHPSYMAVGPLLAGGLHALSCDK